MIVIEPMQDNRDKEESTFDKLIRHFNTIQINTFRYNKHFDVMLKIIVKEHWEEWDKFISAAEQCENTISKMSDNLKSMNMILVEAGSKSVLEKKTDTSNEPFRR